MIADVTHFTVEEGGKWHPWPTKPWIKPSNSLLLTYRRPSRVAVFASNWNGIRIKFHALKLSDGAVWDSHNGFRDSPQVPH